MARKVRRITDPHLIAWGHMMKLLANRRQKGYTVKEIVDVTGLNICTVGRYIAVLHQLKAAHIESFDMDARGAYTIRRWKLGQDDDAVPPARSRSVRAKAQRHREALSRRSNTDKAAHRFDHGGHGATASQPTG